MSTRRFIATKSVRQNYYRRMLTIMYILFIKHDKTVLANVVRLSKTI